MAQRINKVIRDLNIALHTAVEFLHKKGHEIENQPNTKLSDEQEATLIKEFSTDRHLREEAEKMLAFRQRERKSDNIKPTLEAEPEAETATPTKSETPQIKTIGKIDLTQFEKKKKKGESTPTTEKEVEVEQPVVIEPTAPIAKEELTPEPISEPTPQPAPVAVVEPIPEPAAPVIVEIIPEPIAPIVEAPIEAPRIEKVEPQPAVAPKIEKPIKAEPKKPEEPVSDEPFRLNAPKSSLNIQTVGFVDLSTINSSTRPAKKTKEERLKERESKTQQQKSQRQQTSPSSDPKKHNNNNNSSNALREANAKRSRINKEIIPASAQNNSTGPNGGTSKFAKPTQAGTQRPNPRHDNKKKVERKPLIKEDVSDEEVQKQIKETLARLTAKPSKTGAKYRKEKRHAHGMRADMEGEDMDSKVLKVTEFVTVNELATMMDVPAVKVIQVCFNLGQMVSINQRLDAEVINFVADEFGYTTEYVSAEVVEAIADDQIDTEDDLIHRPPIVTVMGHVDHGKTSLLDYIRNTNVIAGESGGITQHIGAYHVELKDGRMITFLDTPGHEAFTAMRARGAKVTDIAIIIVAADDSVMPQTTEAINHASAAGVPIIFAINKIDKPGANPEKIKEALANMNYLVEDWGGKYQSQEISAKKGLGIEELMEKVLLEAELLDLKANPDRKAQGAIIESSLDKGRGFISTILVQTGTLKVGDVLVAGKYHGRVKAMFNERNQRMNEAGPAEPVIVLGMNGAPTAGDQFNVMETEQEAREIANKREQLQREQSLRTHKILTLDDIGRRIAIGNFQELNIIVKGDVDGSVEALTDSLIRLSTEQIEVKVLHKAVGQISDSDVVLAAASNAIIIGFNVRPSSSARRMAEKDGVDIRQYSIIYDAIDEVKDAMEGMLKPITKQEITATIEIRETFKITKVGTIAGCMVKEGTVKRGNRIRLIRDGIVIFTGELASLKRFKDDVKEVKFGYECGLNIANYNDIRVGDFIESFEEIEVKQTL